MVGINSPNGFLGSFIPRDQAHMLLICRLIERIEASDPGVVFVVLFVSSTSFYLRGLHGASGAVVDEAILTSARISQSQIARSWKSLWTQTVCQLADTPHIKRENEMIQLTIGLMRSSVRMPINVLGCPVRSMWTAIPVSEQLTAWSRV
jgi:hypothetical protein